MRHHLAVLHHAWDQLWPGRRLVARLPGTFEMEEFMLGSWHICRVNKACAVIN